MDITIGFALKEAKGILHENNIDSYAIDAEILLSNITHKSREYLIGYPEEIINEQQYLSFQHVVERRKQKEPIAYITGKKEFWGLEFFVDQNTLIPRPDSETLIETCLEALPDRDLGLNILDLGTGSGCLILSLLSEYNNAHGTGIDINKGAILKAKENSLKLKLDKRVGFVVQDWKKGLDQKFDVVVSNPPYIEKSSKKKLPLDVAVYEPSGALFAGNDGLDCYRAISRLAPDIMKSEAYFFVECGMGQDQKIIDILEESGLTFLKSTKDLSGIVRCLVFVN